jgi:hypothetical protein
MVSQKQLISELKTRIARAERLHEKNPDLGYSDEVDYLKEELKELCK